jgi:biofilm PGA synthesis lipoprotein PgaB
VIKLCPQLHSRDRPTPGKALTALILWGLLAGSLGLSLPARALVILQYHHISEQTPASTSVSPQRFEAHLEAIAASGYQVLDLTTVIGLLHSGESLPDKSVLISFDDSYSSIFEFAFPLLRQRDWPFVVFANTEPVDLGLRGFLSWDQLRRMTAAGAAIANHSVRHPHMVRRLEGENEDEWRQRMSREILDAEQRIKQEIGINHRVFAYPYGEYSAALQALLNELDFIGMGQQSGAASRDQLLALPRFAFGGAYGGAEDFALKLQTLPLPLQAMTIESESGARLQDGVLPAAVKRPVITLQLDDDALMDSLQCYVNGQGLAEKEQTANAGLRFQATQPLGVGRSRYNCTARSTEPGRFHWFSVPFVRPDPSDNRLAEP